ncbi:MAG TPA: class I SAM-dependent methyltransferase [Oculatellaceae cyanobacterium]
MQNNLPLVHSEGISLARTDCDGIFHVRVINKEEKNRLTWDRFVRLQAAAEQIKASLPAACSVLDVGGYEGALAFFLESDRSVDVLDPETTGGTATCINAEDRSYEVVTAVDVLEHINPEQRKTVLSECARVASKLLVLNYPCRESAPAQELMLKLTNNVFVRQHVEWELPDSNWVIGELAELDFDCQIIPHSNVGIWLGQYLVQNLLPNVASVLNSALIANHSVEPFSIPLYHLVAATRKD